MEVEGLLVANLLEALRQLQRHLVWSFAAALLLMVLAIVQPAEVKLPTEVLPLPMPFHGAIAILISAYWVFGALASFSLARANRIITLLKDKQELLAAALTYPSIPTTKVHGPRMVLAAVPPVFVAIELALVFGSRLLSYWPMVGVLLVVVPHVGLAILLRRAVGGGAPDYRGD
ncbi:MAG TPA: hypothetical protein VLK82_05895 [Candidatus Tectomicrobia bacterium]|nr:hypothetical protein [Candidatus Tectomicrobia bacterium]